MSDIAKSASEACDNCRFWVRQGISFGDCHRMPPQFTFSANFRSERYGDKPFACEISRFQNAVWPNIGQAEWCGEYQTSREPKP